MATPFRPRALDTSAVTTRFSRADIEFLGVDHSGSSYEGRVYVNNPDADESTGPATEAGYVGSFHIFGHGGCLGDAGHCDVREQRPYDPRPAPPLTRARKVVIATDALRTALERDEVTVTVVPVITSTGPMSGFDDDIVKVEAVRIVTYR
jgi:hypothetical protein